MKDEIIAMLNCITHEPILAFIHSLVRTVVEDEEAFAASLAIVTREADEHVNG